MFISTMWRKMIQDFAISAIVVNGLTACVILRTVLYICSKRCISLDVIFV